MDNDILLLHNNGGLRSDYQRFFMWCPRNCAEVFMEDFQTVNEVCLPTVDYPIRMHKTVKWLTDFIQFRTRSLFVITSTSP